MSRTSKSRGRGRPAPTSSPRRAGTPSAARKLDPELERLASKLVGGFILRILAMFAIVSVGAEIIVRRAHIPQQNMPLVLSMAVFGITIPFVRGADRVFQRLRAIGIQKLNQRRYADARFVLEYFHRFGNMSFDPRGESHYYLVRALIGLHEIDRAAQMAAWLKQHRKRFEWSAKAEAAVTGAQRSPAADSHSEDKHA